MCVLAFFSWFVAAAKTDTSGSFWISLERSSVVREHVGDISACYILWPRGAEHDIPRPAGGGKSLYRYRCRVLGAKCTCIATLFVEREPLRIVRGTIELPTGTVFELDAEKMRDATLD